MINHNSQSKQLPQLPIGTIVLIPNQGKEHSQVVWTGQIVETQTVMYQNDVSERLTLENCRFIRLALPQLYNLVKGGLV